MTNNDNFERGSTIGLTRRTVLRSAAAASAAGFIGLPAFSGAVLGEEHELELCGKLDILCAIDTSGSLSTAEKNDLQAGVNAFIDALPTDGSIMVGSLEFGNNGVRNKNDLQNPSDLTVTVSAPAGNTPMPAAMDIADQALYSDSMERSDASKLVIVFTDGGPNYTNKQYSVGGLSAPRDDTTDWSTTSGDTPPAYDEEGTAATGNDGRQVTVGEMDETKLVATSIKSAGVGGGATQIATVYVGDVGEDQQAMGTDAQTKYTDLPTYLANHVASSTDFAIDVDVSNINALVENLVAVLQEACPDAACPEGFYYKFEWVEDEEAEGDCMGEFVVYDAHDNVVESPDGIELLSVTCDEDGEPQEACFSTAYDEVHYTVKAGRGTEDFVESGAFCVSGITEHKSNRGGKEWDVTHAISNIVFTCPDEE